MSDARQATDASVIAALRAEVEELKRQLGLANQALDGMRERDSRHRAEVERLHEDLAEAKRGEAALQFNLDHAQRRAEQAERERDEAKADLAQLEEFAKGLVTETQRLQQAEARAEEYHRSLTEAMKVIHEEQARVGRVRGLLADLLRQVEDPSRVYFTPDGEMTVIEAARAALSKEEKR